MLANGERTVEALAGEVGLTVANTSQHLQILRQAGPVSSRREGTSVHYRLASPECSELWRTLRTLAASRLAEVERLAAAYLGSRDELSQSPARSWPGGSRTATTWWCWMCGPPPSMPPGTCPGGIHPGRGAAAAAGRAAADREGRRLPAAYAFAHEAVGCCAKAASRLGGWRMGSRNGRPPAWPSPAPDHDPAEEPAMAAIHPVVDEGLGNSAYVVELGDRRALVVDPARDPTPYLELARWRRLRIAYAAETHLHADFLTGSRRLAADGAQILAPHASRLGFAHRGLEDGQEIDLGGLTLRVLATPGHAPEHASYLLLDGARPVAVFSGGKRCWWARWPAPTWPAPS